MYQKKFLIRLYSLFFKPKIIFLDLCAPSSLKHNFDTMFYAYCIFLQIIFKCYYCGTYVHVQYVRYFKYSKRQVRESEVRWEKIVNESNFGVIFRDSKLTFSLAHGPRSRNLEKILINHPWTTSQSSIYFQFISTWNYLSTDLKVHCTLI